MILSVRANKDCPQCSRWSYFRCQMGWSYIYIYIYIYILQCICKQELTVNCSAFVWCKQKKTINCSRDLLINDFAIYHNIIVWIFFSLFFSFFISLLFFMPDQYKNVPNPQYGNMIFLSSYTAYYVNMFSCAYYVNMFSCAYYVNMFSCAYYVNMFSCAYYVNMFSCAYYVNMYSCAHFHSIPTVCIR